LQRSSPHDATGRRRRALALALAIGWTLELGTAACASAQAASAFPEVPLDRPAPRSYGWAYAALGSGVALIGGSFLMTRSADRAYQDYLSETDPARIEDLYDRAVFYDRVASGSLLTGEALLVTGVYLRFLHNPREPRLGLAVAPGRCALSLRF
jgi:hypothetical protein